MKRRLRLRRAYAVAVLEAACLLAIVVGVALFSHVLAWIVGGVLGLVALTLWETPERNQ